MTIQQQADPGHPGVHMSFIQAEAVVTIINRKLGETNAIRLVKPVAGLYTGRCAHHMHGDPLPDFISEASIISLFHGPVLTIGWCCGQYCEDDQRRIRENTKGVEWTFARSEQFMWGAPDFCDHGTVETHAEDVARWLVDTGFAERIRPSTV